MHICYDFQSCNNFYFFKLTGEMDTTLIKEQEVLAFCLNSSTGSVYSLIYSGRSSVSRCIKAENREEGPEV